MVLLKIGYVEAERDDCDTRRAAARDTGRRRVRGGSLPTG
jgi:hypothetical protein